MSDTKRKIEAIKQALLASEDTLVLDAMSKLDEHGDSSVVSVLIEAYASRDDDAIKSQMATMLSSLKVSGIEEPFIEALQEERYEGVRSELVSFMWNAGAQPVESLGVLTKIAVESDYMVCVEIMTLIESLDGPFEESDILDAMMEIREYLNSDPKDAKKEIITTINDLLLKFERTI